MALDTFRQDVRIGLRVLRKDKAYFLLAVLVLGLGTALSLVPIDALRLVVGSLLLVFGLQWLRKGIGRVSANGLRGMDARSASA